MKRLARDDSGASLILALILITVIATVVSALMGLSDTSLRATLNMRDQASTSATAEAAVQAAVNNIRNSTFNAGTGQHCFGGSDTLSLANFAGTASASVSCTADPITAHIQCATAAQCNRPNAAILTTGNSATEDGITVDQPTGSTFRVHGPVFSNSTISINNGSLTTNNAVYARRACTGTITSTPAASCSYGSPNALGNDPHYAAAISSPPVYRALPTCDTANSVVTFRPGYYDDAVGLTNMMAGNSSCRHSTWWFQPGTYYFDFHNASTTRGPSLSSGDDVWRIDDGYLVAGTPVNAAGAVISTPSVPATIPGACANPLANPTATGVQFIFGGDSQLQIKSGQAEICGTYSTSKPPVAIYGLTSGSATTTALTGLTPSAVTGTGGYTNATVARLSTVDNSYASWKSVKKNDSATVTVTGYAPPAAIPAGSMLTSATVQVTHRHSDNGSSDKLSVDLTPTGGNTISGTVTGHAGGGAFQTDTITLDAAATGAIANAIYSGTFTGATIALTANLSANNDTEDVDAVVLNLSYVAPALRALSGCLTVVPYTGGGSSCALVSSLNYSGNKFYVQGTTYAPGAVMDLTLNNSAEQVFEFGVVLRALWVKETGSLRYDGPVIQIPDDSPGYTLAVYLTAYVCLSGGTCTPGSSSAILRAKVALVDADLSSPTAGQRQVVVISWSGTG